MNVWKYLELFTSLLMILQFTTLPRTKPFIGTQYTIDMERFVELNVHSFNPTKVFAGILSCCLDQKCLLFSIIKERHLYSQENFCGTLENLKNTKV